MARLQVQRIRQVGGLGTCATPRVLLYSLASLLALLFASPAWQPRESCFVGVLETRPRGTAIARPAGGVSKLPSLYVYDHCPFCVRARMIFGLKGIRYNLVWMSNDDVETPIAMVGKKIAPILEMPGQAPMGESLDIVKRIDEDLEWGPAILQPATGREDLKAWNMKTSDIMRLLVRPRYPKGFFPEFSFQRAREAFVRNHPMANPETGVIPEKTEWLQLGPSVWNEWYASHMANTSALLSELNAAFQELEDLINSEESISAGGIGYDDVTFWDRLRGATLIRGLEMGPCTKAYMESMSRATDIPLLTDIAI